jgi:hypothetical protein
MHANMYIYFIHIKVIMFQLKNHIKNMSRNESVSENGNVNIDIQTNQNEKKVEEKEIGFTYKKKSTYILEIPKEFDTISMPNIPWLSGDDDESDNRIPKSGLYLHKSLIPSGEDIKIEASQKSPEKKKSIRNRSFSSLQLFDTRFEEILMHAYEKEIKNIKSRLLERDNYKNIHTIYEKQKTKIYTVYDKTNGSIYICKEQIFKNSEDLSRIINEINIISSLNHDLATKFIGFSYDLNEGIIFIYMNDGNNISMDKIAGYLTLDLLSKYVVQILNVLNYIHNEKNIIHLDITARKHTAKRK